MCCTKEICAWFCCKRFLRLSCSLFTLSMLDDLNIKWSHTLILNISQTYHKPYSSNDKTFSFFFYVLHFAAINNASNHQLWKSTCSNIGIPSWINIFLLRVQVLFSTVKYNPSLHLPHDFHTMSYSPSRKK